MKKLWLIFYFKPVLVAGATQLLARAIGKNAWILKFQIHGVNGKICIAGVFPKNN